MVVIRSVNEIILSLIDFFRIAQPDLDTKPGTVARDLTIDAPSNQLALLYDEISKVSTQQSFRLVIGSDLDKLAKNFGVSRKSATPASGIALLTFSSIPATININKGDLISANNGYSFAVVNGVSINPALINFYRSTATKFRNDLDFVGISDEFAVEVTIQSTTPGIAGNITKYGLSRTTIPSVSNVTNINSFNGGNNQEDDATFRNRVLSVFSGSSVGTALGYKNTALATTGVADAFVVEPGDVLMTRDGSVISESSTGELTVLSEGTGGKVDVVILGNTLTENIDSFIYKDKSNNNDPSDVKNIVVLGQITGDENKTINRRRIDNIKAATLPAQPVESIIQVTGSGSGSNFKPKAIDSFGRITGNYELVKDTSAFAGSPFGFDSFKFITNKISLFEEDRIKGRFNGQDNVTFSDILEIPAIQQNISISNENSTVVVTDRSLIQLLHTPAINVTRVYNSTTGERYTVINQNPNGSGTTNTSGVIKISGNTLPSQSDILQVDYNWVVNFDQFSDYDGRLFNDNLRDVTDSIDWGFSNLVRDEKVTLTENGSANFFVGNTTLPISSIISAQTFLEVDSVVATVETGTFTGRLAVVVTNLLNLTDTVDSVHFVNVKTELYDTAQNDGVFSNASIVVGISLQYTTTIILPTDTKAEDGDSVTVILNATDVFNTTGSVGNVSGTQITVPSANIVTDATEINLKVNYITSVQDLIIAGITAVPFSRSGNGYATNNSTGFNNTIANNVSRRENQTVQINGSNEHYIDLNINNTDVDAASINVLTIVRLSDMVELWNQDNIGTKSLSGTSFHRLILNEFNTPETGDKVLVIYYAQDIRRSQPFTFTNDVFEKDFDNLQYDVVTDKFIVNIHAFESEGSLNYEVFEPNTNVVLASGSDGYFVTQTNPAFALFGTVANYDWSGLVDGYSNPLSINDKKIRIIDATNVNNNGVYDISTYNEEVQSFIVYNDFSKITNNQISIIRLLDGKELWSEDGTIDTVNNRLLFPASTSAAELDSVFITYFTVNGLKKTPTRLLLNVTDSTANSGVISVSGTTINKATDIVFSATNTSLTQPINEALKRALGLSSSAALPSTINLVKIAKLERVTTTNSTSNEVLLVNSLYDLAGTEIKDNGFYSDSFNCDPDLNAFEFTLPATSANETNLDEQIKVGDKFRVTFYYSKTGDSENVSFNRNGTLFTNKFFGLINKVYVSSGFGATQSARLTISSFNQPITGSRYKAFYDYLAPKQNERIIIRYNFNKLIQDVTFNIENNRPINADVLVRQAKQVDIDVVMNVVITDQFKNSSALVLQNLKDKLIAAINANGLGSKLDSSSLINTAFSVDGIGGARILFFNKSGSVGQALAITAKDDEYFSANSVNVFQETR